MRKIKKSTKLKIAKTQQIKAIKMRIERLGKNNNYIANLSIKERQLINWTVESLKLKDTAGARQKVSKLNLALKRIETKAKSGVLDKRTTLGLSRLLGGATAEIARGDFVYATYKDEVRDAYNTGNPEYAKNFIGKKREEFRKEFNTLLADDPRRVKGFGSIKR